MIEYYKEYNIRCISARETIIIIMKIAYIISYNIIIVSQTMKRVHLFFFFILKKKNVYCRPPIGVP